MCLCRVQRKVYLFMCIYRYRQGKKIKGLIIYNITGHSKNFKVSYSTHVYPLELLKTSRNSTFTLTLYKNFDIELCSIC